MSFVDITALDDLVAGEPVRIEVQGTPVCLVRVEDEVFAIHDICTHALESLSGGWVNDDRIECPRHGAEFSLRTGDALSLPATKAVPTFPVEIHDGRVLLDPTASHPHPLVT